MAAPTVLPSLMACLSQLSDPRQPRGVRHPFSAILGLTLLGLVCRVTDFASLQRWAAGHWHLIRGPLGFTRRRPPHATTLSRTLAQFSLEELQQAFSQWLSTILTDKQLLIAVDGKTSRQGFDADGNPIHLLNVFATDLKACLGHWPLAGDKKTEPEVLKAHLAELFAKYPGLLLITGDALYCQRNLAEMIVASGHDYLFQLKGNQPEVLEAAKTCLADKRDGDADATKREKKGGASRLVFFGSMCSMPNMSGSGWVLPVAECSCESTDCEKSVMELWLEKQGTSSPASTRPR